MQSLISCCGLLEFIKRKTPRTPFVLNVRTDYVRISTSNREE